ncbi:hypothetical protein ZIOFF_037233 [Zingiber officinale]|uniref:Uncharacterized protein n=1 Tax=Zingiber officinale TaxID=94328 RepID=A0A8J5GB99_ZINOF|nr:hypothetical protein ZIOFF_037233 [Zingiber officinale]
MPGGVLDLSPVDALRLHPRNRLRCVCYHQINYQTVFGASVCKIGRLDVFSSSLLFLFLQS